MSLKRNLFARALFCSCALLCADLNLRAQGFILPSPMKVIPVEKLDFNPDANNSCISVEGPEIIKHEDNTLETLPDAFTSCALNLFAPILNVKFKDGTQKTDDAIEALMQCSNASLNPKHMILIGHGSQGSIATGNGTNPQDGQNIDVGTTRAIDSLRSLKALEVLLFGCETGVGKNAVPLLNNIAQKFPARARNSIVMCSLDETHNGVQKGLYVFLGADQEWITAQPNEPRTTVDEGAVVELDQDSCFALKDTNQQFKVIMPGDFKRKKQRGEISLFDFQSESALRQRVFSEFEMLPPGVLTQDNFRQLLADDPDVLDSIDFCQVLRPDLVPDRNVIGTFTLKIDGTLRHFYQLRGGLVQDAEHRDVYYRMKTNAIEHLHFFLQNKSNEMFLKMQQEKLQKIRLRDKN